MSNPDRRLSLVAIDDDRGDLVLLARLLARVARPQVLLSSFQEPARALRHLVRAPCDLVVVDYDLGGWTGLEVHREIVRVRPGLPVILWTDRDDPGLFRDAIERGVATCLSKRRVDAKSLRLSLERLVREP